MSNFSKPSPSIQLIIVSAIFILILGLYPTEKILLITSFVLALVGLLYEKEESNIKLLLQIFLAFLIICILLIIRVS